MIFYIVFMIILRYLYIENFEEGCNSFMLYTFILQTLKKLLDGPEDVISALKFSSSNPQLLLVSSWDTSLRLYSIEDVDVKKNFKLNRPILDCCFQVFISFNTINFFQIYLIQIRIVQTYHVVV